MAKGWASSYQGSQLHNEPMTFIVYIVQICRKLSETPDYLMAFTVSYNAICTYSYHCSAIVRNTQLSKKSRDSAIMRALRSHQQLSALEDQHSINR